jgi:hypothetical protein
MLCMLCWFHYFSIVLSVNSGGKITCPDNPMARIFVSLFSGRRRSIQFDREITINHASQMHSSQEEKKITAAAAASHAPSFLSGRALRPPFKLFMRLRKPPPLEGFSPSLLVGRVALSAVTLLVRPLPWPLGIAELADKLRVADGRSCSAMRI